LSTPEIVEGQRIAKLEEELFGWKKQAIVTSEKSEKPLKPAEEQQSHSISFELKVMNRRRRVFELRGLGYKVPDIQKKLADEGQFWSEDTVKTDLRSDDAKEFLEELQRQQLVDIALSKSRKLKLEFRDRLIERMTPRKSPETQVNVGVNVQPKISVEILDHSKELSSTGDKA
jgi:hypothetical protein